MSKRDVDGSRKNDDILYGSVGLFLAGIVAVISLWTQRG